MNQLKLKIRESKLSNSADRNAVQASKSSGGYLTFATFIQYTLGLLIVIASISYLVSCSSGTSTDLVGNWSKSSDFEGVGRSRAVSFTINNLAYVGTGTDGKKALKDFWSYDSEKKNWTQIAEFPGEARYSAAGFGVGNKGYVGTGYNGDTYIGDFYEYDPSSNAWTKKANFGGTARFGAIGFSIDAAGYIGTGYDGNYLKDLWQYDPATDKWTQKVSLGGSKRREASCFVMGGKAYVVAGIENGSFVDDFWKYDPAADSWTQLNSISNHLTNETFDDLYTTIQRSGAVAFANDQYAYLALGGTGSLLKNVWEYNPVTDLWQEKTNFEGSVRSGAVGFTINGRFFITTGASGGYQLDDTWEFKPADIYDANN
jgi:N-acetylneuraminic acid mutarotase